MKFIYKVWVSLIIVGFLSSCDLDLLDNPNAVTPDNASVELVMNNVFIELPSTWVGLSAYYDGVIDLTNPFMRMSAMQGSKLYDQADGPESYDFLWSQIYSTLIPDLNLVIDRSTADGVTTYSGVAKVLKAYIMFTLVDLFGDVPYSDAFQSTDKLSPALDDDESVYNAAFAILESAIADLSDPKGTPIANDLYYSGSIPKWLKLANTLKLRYYLTTRLVNSNAITEFNNLINNPAAIISARADDWEFHYGTNRAAPDSRHQWYSDSYESGGLGIYMANYRMWTMFGEKDTEDPRIRYYFYRQDCNEDDEDFFTLQCQDQPYPFHWPDGWPYCTASSDWGDPAMEYGGYWGRDHGDDSGIPPDDLKRTVWGVYPAGGKFDADNCSQVSNGGIDGLKGKGILPLIATYNVHFWNAEMKLVSGDEGAARAALEAGVRESIDKVMDFGAADAAGSSLIPSQAQIDAYVAEVLAMYDSEDTDGKLNVIMKESWLSMQSQGLDAYNAYRRTCKPEGMQWSLESNPGNFPSTFWYPASFVNRNENVDQKPNLDVKVFWDNAGCTRL